MTDKNAEGKPLKQKKPTNHEQRKILYQKRRKMQLPQFEEHPCIVKCEKVERREWRMKKKICLFNF